VTSSDCGNFDRTKYRRSGCGSRTAISSGIGDHSGRDDVVMGWTAGGTSCTTWTGEGGAGGDSDVAGDVGIWVGASCLTSSEVGLLQSADSEVCGGSK
jgi:hypothetical protein